MRLSLSSLCNRLPLPVINVRRVRPSPLLVYGISAAHLLENFVLDGLTYEVFVAPREIPGEFNCYLSLKVVKEFIAAIPLLFADISIVPIGQKLRYIAGNLLRLYQLSAIRAHGARLVLSASDTSFDLQWLNRHDRELVYWTIGNSPRDTINVTSQLFKSPPHPAATIYLTNFFGQGEREYEVFTRHGHVIENFYATGSVRASAYRTWAAQAAPLEKRFDICLVSQYVENVMEEPSAIPELCETLQLLHNFLAQYIKERNYSLCIALRGNTQKEIDYFFAQFGSNVHVQAYSLKGMSSYASMDASRLVVAHDSSAAREAFGWGAKVLFTNYSGNPLRNFYHEGPWLTVEPDYVHFCAAMDNLFNMHASDYEALAGPLRNKVVKFDMQHPAHLYLREKVLQFLDRQEST